MKARRLAVALTAALAASTAAALMPVEVGSELPGAQLRGEGELSWFGLSVYDARLWMAPGGAARAETGSQPLALTLTYARALEGHKIAERSLQEMRRAGPIDAATAERWLQAMKRCFPDVRPGDRITGVLKPGAPTRFFVNSKPSCEVADADFGQRFFGIWLAPTTSEPKLRAALLGEPR